MRRNIKILVAEDSPDDTDLLLAELRRAGFAPAMTRVETEPDFLAELQKQPDLILSDYSMPQFSGLRAAELARASGLNIPFILISGTVGEEVAVEAMKVGVTDYLLKDRLTRLGSAVERALREAKDQARRQQVEEELRQSEHRFREMLGNLQLIAMILDRQGRVTFTNDYLLHLTGRTRAEVIGADWFEKFIPEADAGLRKLFFNSILSGAIPAHHQNPIKTAHGELRDILWNNTTLRDAAGNVVGTASIGEDVTERVRAEAKLRESELKFRQIAENIREVFWITEPAKKQMLYISPAYEGIWGRSCLSLYQSPQAWIEAVHPGDRTRILLAATTRQVAGSYDEIYRIVRPDGETRWIHDRAFPVRDENGEVYRIVGVAEDITEQRKLEEQFRQSQKMEAIGLLAGGVAHDFNNQLAVIQMNCHLLQTGAALPASQLEFAEGIDAATQRAGALTRQLLLFSRKETMQPRDLDLNQVIGGMTRMLQRVLGEHIRLEFKFSTRPLLIHADPGMIDQVLMNLVVNSRDAMPKGGDLVIETSVVEFDEQSAAQTANARPGSFACLSVSDTGCGISPENLGRVFEPFFTTKPVGKGTGLGLATVFGIVQQHQGWICVRSDVGQGAIFQIFLPRLWGAPTETVGLGKDVPLPGGAETILLVEDDAFLRSSLCATLSKLSYRVLEAGDGIQALEVWRRHRDEIQLLLTDLIMPGGINGKELGELLSKDNPGLKVVYSSGYSADMVDNDFVLTEGVNFLAKPFQADKLAQILRLQLDRRDFA